MDWRQLWEIVSAADNVPIIALIPLLAFYIFLAWRQAHANDLLIELKHSQWNRLTQSGVLAQFSATPCVVERAAPLLGEHTEEILVNDLGYTPQRVAELRERKIIRTR